MLNAAPGGPFGGLFFAQGFALQIGGVAQREYVQALDNVQQSAIALAGQLNIDNEKAAAIGALAFAVVHKVNVDGQSLTEQNVFAANEINAGTIITGPESSVSGFTSNARKTDGPNPLCCQDGDYECDKKEQLCGMDKRKGCPCLNLVSHPPFDQHDTSISNDQGSVLASLFGSRNGGPTPTASKLCSHESGSDNEQGGGRCNCNNSLKYPEVTVEITSTVSAGSTTVFIDPCPYTTYPSSTYIVVLLSRASSAASTASFSTTLGSNFYGQPFLPEV